MDDFSKIPGAESVSYTHLETVSVLKGAAATALYGSRGLNGAVVITTKGGGKFKGFGVDVTQMCIRDRRNTIIPSFVCITGT